MTKHKRGKGKVYLVGAGPGDPGLLTVKGLESLKKAQVIIYDALVNPKILNWANPKSLKICARLRRKGDDLSGKERRDEEQSTINRLLHDYACKGKTVVRLKGGDPFLFGRGSEEAEYLAERGVAFEIVPGVTSAIAVPAYAGIPVTDRRHTSILTIVTGHSREAGTGGPPVEWKKIPQGTLVVLMGVENISTIVKNLVDGGWPASTPAALVRSGTLPNQQMISGTLGDILSKLKKLKKPFLPPAVIIIGDVVGLKDKIGWFA